MKTITDPLDHTTEYFYDQEGNKIREVDPKGKDGGRFDLPPAGSVACMICRGFLACGPQ